MNLGLMATANIDNLFHDHTIGYENDLHFFVITIRTPLVFYRKRKRNDRVCCCIPAICI